MKKHLLGLGIFSFIFVSFAALFAFLYAPRIPQIVQVEEIKRPVIETDARYRCNKKFTRDNILPIEVIQPNILNQVRSDGSGKNRFFFAKVKKDNLTIGTKIAFHFFVADGKNIRYAATENYEINYVSFDNGISVASANLNLGEWQNKFSKKNNFYVIPQVITEEFNSEVIQPKFETDKAFSVLWRERE